MDSALREIIHQHQQNWPDSFHPLLTPFLLTLHRSHTILLGQAFKVMAKHDLSPAEFDVLCSLRRSPPPHELTPSQLQHSLLITSGGLTKIFHQLEKRGLITRSTTPGDRRIKPVRMTKTAAPIIELAIQAVLSQGFGWITADLTTEEIDQVTKILGKLLLHQPQGED